MKNFVKICGVAAMMLVAMPALAEQPMTMDTKGGGMMMCPMMGKMDKMQKDMGSMMQQMDEMMKAMSDPAMKEKAQKMRDDMDAMMKEMQKKPDMGMMGGTKTDTAPATNDAADAAAPAVSPEDHKAHHPEGGAK